MKRETKEDRNVESHLHFNFLNNLTVNALLDAFRSELRAVQSRPSSPFVRFSAK